MNSFLGCDGLRVFASPHLHCLLGARYVVRGAVLLFMPSLSPRISSCARGLKAVPTASLILCLPTSLPDVYQTTVRCVKTFSMKLTSSWCTCSVPCLISEFALYFLHYAVGPAFRQSKEYGSKFNARLSWWNINQSK